MTDTTPAPAKKAKQPKQWLSGRKAAHLLGFHNFSAIQNFPIKHLKYENEKGRICYRYHISDVEAYRASITRN